MLFQMIYSIILNIVVSGNGHLYCRNYGLTSEISDVFYLKLATTTTKNTFILTLTMCLQENSVTGSKQ